MKLFSLLVLFLIVGCSSLSTKESYTLRLIGDYAFDVETKFEELPFGGISGITYDKNSRTLIAISDDRSKRGPARFYHLGLNIDESYFDVKIKKMVTLKGANSRPFKEGEVDFEGIALTPAKEIVLSSEGDNRTNPRTPPSIMIFSQTGSYKGWVNLPTHFIPEHKGEPTKGPRNNKALESLGITLSGKYLFTGSEDTMYQDGPLVSTDKEGVIRILRLERAGSTFEPKEEFAYSLDKVPPVHGLKEKPRGINGLVELVPLSKDILFSMERAWTPENRKQTIKIFKVDLNDATDVSKLTSLTRGDFKLAKKTLIANLDDFIPLLKQGKRKLDNIEGIAIGPKLSNGNYTLIVVSDDNFNKRQRTMLMAFEIL